jgi:hypothetical protein
LLARFHVTEDQIMNSEPALTIGGVTAAIQAGVASLVAAGGFNLSSKQEGAIIAFVTLVIGLLSSTIIRSHVFAPTTVAKIQSGELTAATPGPQSLGVGAFTARRLAAPPAIGTSAAAPQGGKG